MSGLAVKYYIEDVPQNLCNDTEAEELLVGLTESFPSDTTDSYLKDLSVMNLKCLSLFLVKNQKTTILEKILPIISETNINLNELIIDGFHPLHYSVDSNNIALLSLLAEHYLYIDHTNPYAIRNSDGFYLEYATPLHFATLLGEINIIKFLLNKGADVHSTYVMFHKDLGHFTELPILNFPAYYGMFKVVKLLLDYGADPYKVNNRGYNSIHVAEVNGHYNIRELLINHKRQNIN
jgi:ankyrin repeat protein